VRIPQFKLVLGVICEQYICEVKILCAIFGVCDLMTVIIPVLRSVAGKRLVETEKS
jgi:hypothetical protein